MQAFPRIRTVLLAPVLATCIACSAPEGRRPADDGALADTLRLLIENAYDFSRPGVVERMSALYPETGRVISASGGELITSVDTLRQGIEQFWQNVGRNMREPRWVWGEVHVNRLTDHAAVMTSTWSIPHTAPDDRPHVIRGAWTAIFQRLDGEWKIVQEHLSAPPE